jgi:nicotinamidase-related amidase
MCREEEDVKSAVARLSSKRNNLDMPARNLDLHGNVPDNAKAVLLLIDVINNLEFPEGETLLKYALPMAEQIVTLKQRAQRAGIPAIYVNDNFGKWRSDFKGVIQYCLTKRGRPLVERLCPQEEDYFVLKPKHSGFFSTTLDLLLEYLQAKTIILTGLTTNACVLFTAHDAYMRDFHLIVPADCVAAADENDHTTALQHMAKMLKADIQPSAALDTEKLQR